MGGRVDVGVTSTARKIQRERAAQRETLRIVRWRSAAIRVSLSHQPVAIRGAERRLKRGVWGGGAPPQVATIFRAPSGRAKNRSLSLSHKILSPYRARSAR